VTGTHDVGREELGMLPDLDDGFLHHIIGHDYGKHRVVARIVETAGEALYVLADHGRDASEQDAALVVVEAIPLDGDDPRHPVVDEHSTLSVEDPPPRGRLGNQANLVALGRHLVGGRGQNLEVPEPGEQGREQ
jgi:hypothetical protein